jgi:hypothetical protein
MNYSCRLGASISHSQVPEQPNAIPQKKLLDKLKSLTSLFFEKISCFVGGSLVTLALNPQIFWTSLVAIAFIMIPIYVFQGALLLGCFLYSRFFDSSQPTTVGFKSSDLIPAIKNLREENEVWKSNFKILEDFINKDEDLVSLFKVSVEKTKNILLKPYIIGEAESNDPIVAEWATEAHLQLYYEALYDRLMDFLRKNPEFTKLLKEKLGQIGKNTILDKPKN